MTRSRSVDARGRMSEWRRSFLGAVIVFSIASGEVYAQAEDPRAVLKEMTDYITGQQTFSALYDTDIEVVTTELEKIQFTASGEMLVDRNSGLRAKRTGGYSKVELVFDGKSLTLYSEDSESYATVEAPGSIDELVDRLRDEFSIEVPGADLLLAGAYEKLTEDVRDAKYIGLGVIDGVECHHLAFRNAETDWQIWIEAGERPVPRKYVITSKTVALAPQYSLRVKELRTDVSPEAAAFEFRPSPGAKKVAIDELGDIDDVPPGISEEEHQP